MKTPELKKGLYRLEVSEVKPLAKTDLLEIHGREWFDRINGNSYHCVYISINDKLVITVPFTYGYDRMYIQNATEALKDAGYIPNIDSYKMVDRYCRENGIHCVCHIQTGCKKNQLAKF